MRAHGPTRTLRQGQPTCRAESGEADRHHGLLLRPAEKKKKKRKPAATDTLCSVASRRCQDYYTPCWSGLEDAVRQTTLRHPADELASPDGRRATDVSCSVARPDPLKHLCRGIAPTLSRAPLYYWDLLAAASGVSGP